MLICVTNRLICQNDFFLRLKQIARGNPHAIMLREKDLGLSDYKVLAQRVNMTCQQHRMRLIVNQNIEAAYDLGIPFIHLSLSDFRVKHKYTHSFTEVGVSIHSASEAVEAQKLGAHYLIAGHIFATACKEGVPPRGLPFLEEVCQSVDIPVFAIGGITPERVQAVIRAGAKGVCVMNEAMTNINPSDLVNKFNTLF